MTLESIKWKNGKLTILDQTLLPTVCTYREIKNVNHGWNAINEMQVRGAPAIAITACLSLAAEIRDKEFTDKKYLCQEVESKLNYLVSARPTAVNVKIAAEALIDLSKKLCKDQMVSPSGMKETILSTITAMLEKDISDNKTIGEHGADEILHNVGYDSKITILTHCNTGSLATAGYGTALGVIRSLHARKRLEHVYCTETRPYNQGARLTAFEIVQDKLPGTLICDDMVAALMKSKKITAVIVGADRVAANGDTANKIGTYQIAIIAKYHNVPFYVAAPRTSIDFTILSGDRIVIEERDSKEITHMNGQRITPDIDCWNPAFDVTPASLITAIITDIGVFKPEDLVQLKSLQTSTV